MLVQALNDTLLATNDDGIVGSVMGNWQSPGESVLSSTAVDD